MKILLLDIETAPIVAYTWGLWKQDIYIDQIIHPGGMLSFAAKWYKEPNSTVFRSTFHDGTEAMVQEAWKLMDEADAIAHWNGNDFDIPILNTEFIKFGRTPPSPSKQVDLMRTAKKVFRFPSNKLQYVSTALGLAGKFHNSGFSLWKRCLANDPDAWEEMKTYNIADVDPLLEDLLDILLPWIPSFPNRRLYDAEVEEADGCPRCGSWMMTKQGFRTTGVGRFQRYRCASCGGWSTAGSRVSGTKIQGERA